ncbi:MAG: RNA polymerase sigma factor [Bradymonadia bacterium]
MCDRDRDAKVRAMLSQLTPKRRLVIILREVEGLDPGEIAQALGIPRITVRTRLHQARRDLLRLAARDEAFLSLLEGPDG